jgi:hypothetical protein
MKKLFTYLTALVLLVSTSGLVMAQGTTSAQTTPVAKKVMKKKTHKSMKKSVKPVSTTVAK